MSVLEVLDRAAGATKSGGTTRRAAKMVCLDMDHPEIIDFIEWKVREEKKARALIAAGYESDFNGDAYHTVSGQNSNNSLRVTDEFMNAVETDGEWKTTLRTTGEVCDTYRARDVWRKVAQAAWGCADPGLQYDTTINDWHTCPNTDRINASNPCSEYMFLDDTACNLASLNLMSFVDGEGGFCVEDFKRAAALTILRGFTAAGKPKHGNPPLGGFEDWDALVRGALIWAGADDPLETRDRVRRAGDADLDALRVAPDAWQTKFPNAVTTAEAVQAAKADPELLAVFAAFCDCPSDRIDSRKLSGALRRYAGRVADGLRFTKGAADAHAKINRWIVESCG